MDRMPSHGLLDHQAIEPATAIVTVCTHRKTTRPPTLATAVSLPINVQDAVQSAWIEKVRSLPPHAKARALYGGRGFGLATQAAKICRADLYIISAGLGLVSAERKVPVYGITVSAGHTESVAARVTGKFDARAWFSSLLAGPYSHQWAEVIGEGSGRVLLALTRPYAALIGETLAGLAPEALSRLRIFGASLATVLPSSLHPAIAPYDRRLDTVLPGTRADFSQRALLHFVRCIALRHGAEDRDADYAAIDAALRDVSAPVVPHRQSRTDDEILRFIQVRLSSQTGIGRTLRALRDQEGVACEQLRFNRLYREALERRTAA
jgi:hypothetical protein